MRILTEGNRRRTALMGIVVTVLVIGVGQSVASVPLLFAQPTYYAQFADTAGLSSGDKVRIAGVDVGLVRSIEIDGDKVVIGYTLSGTRIGSDSTAAIRTDTLLGRRNIEISRRVRSHWNPVAYFRWATPARRIRSTTRSSTSRRRRRAGTPTRSSSR